MLGLFSAQNGGESDAKEDASAADRQVEQGGES